MSEVFIRKLESLSALQDSDKALIGEIIGKEHPRSFSGCLIEEGDVPQHVHLVTSGLAYRYKMLEDGRRQIVAFLLPGDICNLYVFILRAMDHGIGCVKETSVIQIPREDVERLLEAPRIAKALLMSVLVDEAVLREWVTNVGQRRAEVRIAHLFCEIHARLRVVGRVHSSAFELPVTQVELADTLGLSPVHINRSLQALREDGLLTFKGGLLHILDVSRLETMSGFRPNYLHLAEDGTKQLSIRAT